MKKILSVPATKIDPFFKDISDYISLPKSFLNKIEHFFQRYKELESNKWVKILGWKDANYACQIINESIDRMKHGV